MNSLTYWSQQSSSFGPSDTAEYYAEKADEHAQLMRPEDREANSVDLACGAGELLQYLQHSVNVTTGIDYSASMIAAARDLLGDGAPELIEGDVFEYLKEATHPVWMTTGGLNQYLPANRLADLVELFHANQNARSFYLFDCIDPIRYHIFIFNMGISYRPDQLQKVALSRRAIKWMRRAKFSLQLMFGRYSSVSMYLGSAGMGYAYRPLFWREIAQRLGIEIRIVSSRFFEYRYHVIFSKSSS